MIDPVPMRAAKPNHAPSGRSTSSEVAQSGMCSCFPRSITMNRFPARCHSAAALRSATFADYGRIGNIEVQTRMNPAILNSQFVQVALPIVLTIFIAAWMNGRAMDVIGKRIDDLNKRIDDLRRDLTDRLDGIEIRLVAIEGRLTDFGERLTRVEERTSPIGRRG
jgi:hypothetical protein